MDVSRRGFLRFLGGVSVAVAGAATAVKDKAGETITAAKSIVNNDEEKLLRYWHLKNYLGSKEYDRTTGSGMFPKENQALWNEYYELCDYFGSVYGEPCVRMVMGKLVVLDTKQKESGWSILLPPEKRKRA